MTLIVLGLAMSSLAQQTPQSDVRLVASVPAQASLGVLDLTLTNAGTQPILALEMTGVPGIHLDTLIGWDSRVSELPSVILGCAAYGGQKVKKLKAGGSISGVVYIPDLIDVPNTANGTYEIFVVYDDHGENYKRRTNGQMEVGNVGKVESQPIYLAVRDKELVYCSTSPVPAAVREQLGRSNWPSMGTLVICLVVVAVEVLLWRRRLMRR